MNRPLQPVPARVVLVEPEIPNNTGSIARTCVATGSELHLVHPLGFDIDEKACRRAGLDYWPRVKLTEHDTLDAYERSIDDPARVWLFSSRATRSCFDAPIQPGDHLVFGRESVGLPAAMLGRYPSQLVRIPMVPGERSLNVSNAAAVAVFDLVRKMVGSGDRLIDESGALVDAPETPETPA